MNLLRETLETMESVGKTPVDVAWIGAPSFGWFTWNDFVDVADQRYYVGPGVQEVATDIVVMFKDGKYMNRGEDNGSEWWETHLPINRPSNYRKPLRVVGGAWESLGDLNEQGGGGEPRVQRERRINGNDICKNGHVYPSKDAMQFAHDNTERLRKETTDE